MENPYPYPKNRLDPTRTTGLILCGMGGPDGPDAVEPFLRNLFADPAIFPVPKPIGPVLGRLLARIRTPGVRRRYLTISPDGATAQLPTTRHQSAELARRLDARGRPTVSGVAMRYWRPFPDETVLELRGCGAEQFLVVPTYPQYSRATGGSTLGFVLDALQRLAPAAAVHVLAEWGLESGFVAALAGPVATSLTEWAASGSEPAACAWVSVAHSLPQKLIDGGDPYLDQTRATVAAVHAEVARRLAGVGHGDWFAALPGGAEPLLGFQSRVGPIRWIGPRITTEVERLARAGCRRLHVQPISFTCEHIETLLELDIELKDAAARVGITDFRRGAALNLDPGWLDSLAEELARTAFDTEDDARA